MNDIINIEKFIKDKEVREFPKSFTLADLFDYSEDIEKSLNEMYELSISGKLDKEVCTDEQFKILANVYKSFFTIAFAEYDNFDNSEYSMRIMYEFIGELHKICSELPNIESMRKDSQVINLQERKDKYIEECEKILSKTINKYSKTIL